MRPGQAGPTRETLFAGGRWVGIGSGLQTMAGQMYAHRVGAGRPDRPPVVLIHGACYEEAPDGRPGLGPLLVRAGWTVYVVDQPGVGRSRYVEQVHGPLTHYPPEQLERMFTATRHHQAWPQANRHTQWPGGGRIGDPIFDAYYATQVGHIGDYRISEPLMRTAGTSLLEQLGRSFLVTHSQSGPAGWHIADQCPELVAGIVALEPKGPTYFDLGQDDGAHPARPFGITATPLTYDPSLSAETAQLPWQHSRTSSVLFSAEDSGYQQASPARRLQQLSDTPVLLVTGEASYHALFDHMTVQFLQEADVPVEHLRLADIGIHGNGHLLMYELNNHDIATAISTWMNLKAGV
jgi:pimeloyl-ACP methyl ester carboxylesterase